MLTSNKESIIEYLNSEPNSNTSDISRGVALSRSITYESLCDLEYSGIVARSAGLDGVTLTFNWNLVN